MRPVKKPPAVGTVLGLLVPPDLGNELRGHGQPATGAGAILDGGNGASFPALVQPPVFLEQGGVDRRLQLGAVGLELFQ